MAKRLKLYEVHLFYTSQNSRQLTTSCYTLYVPHWHTLDERQVHSILKTDLQLKCLKYFCKTNVQELTAASKQVTCFCRWE